MGPEFQSLGVKALKTDCRTECRCRLSLRFYRFAQWTEAKWQLMGLGEGCWFGPSTSFCFGVVLLLRLNLFKFCWSYNQIEDHSVRIIVMSVKIKFGAPSEFCGHLCLGPSLIDFIITADIVLHIDKFISVYSLQKWKKNIATNTQLILNRMRSIDWN